MNNKIKIHKRLCDQLNETYQKKNSDYGDSFGKSVRKRGITAAMVRMEDKWNRLDNLTLHPENIMVNDETIGDTLLDLANYCLMTYMELNPIKEDACTAKAIADCVHTYSPGYAEYADALSTDSGWVNKNTTIISAVNQSMIDYAKASHCDKEYE